MWYWLFKYVAMGPALWLATRPKVTGADQLPRSGPVIVAANHSAFIDSLILCLVLPRRLTFLAKQEYFIGAGVRGRLQRWFFTAAGQVPVDRRGGDAAHAALRTAEAIVAAGGVWAIHPEGTRTSTGHLHRGHTGMMRVAADTATTVLPIGLRGTERIGPRGRWRSWRPHRVEVVIGRPIAPADLTRLGIREATDEVMCQLAVLSARPYLDEYAAPSPPDRLAHRR